MSERTIIKENKRTWSFYSSDGDVIYIEYDFDEKMLYLKTGIGDETDWICFTIEDAPNLISMLMLITTLEQQKIFDKKKE